MQLPLAAIALDNGTVLILIGLVVLPISAALFARAGAAWSEIGGGLPAIAYERPSRTEREAEVRQMIEAKSYLRQRRGEAPLDIRAETERQCADFIGLDD